MAFYALRCITIFFFKSFEESFFVVGFRELVSLVSQREAVECTGRALAEWGSWRGGAESACLRLGLTFTISEFLPI